MTNRCDPESEIAPPSTLLDGTREVISATVLVTWFARGDGRQRMEGTPGALQWAVFAVPLPFGYRDDSVDSPWFQAAGIVPSDLRPVVPGQEVEFRCAFRYRYPGNKEDKRLPCDVRIVKAVTATTIAKRERSRQAHIAKIIAEREDPSYREWEDAEVDRIDAERYFRNRL